MHGDALSQVWLFIVAPLLGGAIAALVYWFLFDADTDIIIETDIVVGEIIA